MSNKNDKRDGWNESSYSGRLVMEIIVKYLGGGFLITIVITWVIMIWLLNRVKDMQETLDDIYKNQSKLNYIYKTLREVRQRKIKDREG